MREPVGDPNQMVWGDTGDQSDLAVFDFIFDTDGYSAKEPVFCGAFRNDNSEAILNIHFCSCEFYTLCQMRVGQ